MQVLDATPGCIIERSPRLLPLLDRRLAADPEDIDNLRLRGDILAHKGEWDKAAVDFERAWALDSRSSPSWFSIGWWVIGPYTEDMQVANPPEKDPDPFGALAHPQSNVDARGGGIEEKRFWRAADPGIKDYLSFGDLFDHAEHISAYAVTRVYSQEERQVVIVCGADDTSRLWLNGEKVYESLINHWATPDQDALMATLRAGWNTLLVRVSNATNVHALYLRLSDDPEDRIRALMGIGHFQEASGLAEEALARSPNRPRLQQLTARIRVERQRNYVKEERWGREAADLAREVEVAPDDARKWFHGTVAQLVAGRPDLYGEQCRAMLRRFGDARDWVTAERISKACLLRPDDPSVVAQAAKLAGRGLEDAPDNPWTLFAAGLASYRTGDHESALDRMKRGREASTIIDRSEIPCYEASTLLVEAMACARLDRMGAARQSLDQADRMLEGRFPREGASSQYPTPWPDWALCQILWREAGRVVRDPP